MDFKTLCTGCRTYRCFTQEKIAPEVLDELMDNVRIANSAMNGQVLRYVLVKDPDRSSVRANGRCPRLFPERNGERLCQGR